MIISHEHKFIFIKTMKTAGTSIEIALSKFCGAGDVITPITPADEAMRRELGFRGAQNYIIPFTRYSAKDWARLVTRRTGRKRFVNHMPARRVRRAIDPEVWNSYFKFCVERNPWDKVVSLYYWRHQSEPRPSLSQFIQSGEMTIGVRRGGYDVYSIDGQVAVDRILRYERLNEELQDVAAQLKLPGTLQLPRAKGGTRRDRRSYREVLAPEDAAAIAKAYAREIAYMKYEF